MDEFFGPGGRLEATLPAFEPRAEQAALAEAVAEALELEEHLLAEAGTGTGKSLAYLIPALATGMRVVVATATKTLQEQLSANDVPAAAAALGREVDCALLKGRENYLCRWSLHGLELLGGLSRSPLDPATGSPAGALFRTAEDAAQFEELRSWIETTETGDRAELPLEPRPSLWAELAVGGDRCLGRRCALRGVCFSEAARERAASAELVITNHALYLADLALRSGGHGREAGILPDHEAVVFDEAHRLEDTAASWFGGRVSLRGLRLLARDVERLERSRASAPPARLLAELDRLGQAVIAPFAPSRGRRRLRAPDIEPVTDLGLALGDVLGRLAETLAGGGEEADALARRALATADDLEACLAPSPETVAWGETGAIAWAPVDVSDALREALWESGVTAILVSATLAGAEGDSGDDGGGGEYSFLRRRLGIDHARELTVGSPFDFADQALLYVPARFPEPRSGPYFERLREEVVALCRLSRGRALVLTSSYRALDELTAGAAEALPYPVLYQGQAPRERLLDRFRAETDSVLIATSTFWQGVDVPGDSLSLLVIDKLPFAPPDDPLVEARCERLASDGQDWFTDYALPRAVLQLRQGFGRLIRSREDRGVVAILDVRLRTRAYGRRFLAALPRCALVSDRNAVADFFMEGRRGAA